MPRKKMSNVHKATAGGALATVVSAYAAAKASQYLGLPLELTTASAGVIVGYLFRLTAKMLPDV